MRNTRVGLALALKLGAALAIVLLLATEPPLDAQSALASQLMDRSIDRATLDRLLKAARELEPRVERFAPEGLSPVDLHFWVTPSSSARAERLVEATRLALSGLATWFGEPPSTDLVVIDVPWMSGLAGASYPGVVVASTRWIAPARDVALERSLIGAIARQYWFESASREGDEAWFDEGLVLYTGARAIHDTLENNDPTTAHFLGGHVPVVIRPLQLSPNRADPRPRVRHFAEIEEPRSAPWRAAPADRGGRAQRAALALHTLERYVGWPAMQSMLAAYRERSRGKSGSAMTFAAVVSEQRGRDLSWFFAEAFRFEARLDYAISALQSQPVPGDSSQFRSVVAVQRLGDAVFTGTNDPPVGAFEAGRALHVWALFEDGSIVRDTWDGRDKEKQIEYVGPSPIVSASVDPNAIVLLDADRTNNTRTLRWGRSGIGVRLALHWLVWLQDLVLSYSALA